MKTLSEKIEKQIEKEVDKRSLQIKTHNESLLKRNQQLTKELETSKLLVEDLKKGDLFSKYATNVNDSNINTFLTFIFSEIENPDTNSEVTKASNWFLNIIKYWSNRELLFKIYDLIGVKYPAWAKTMQIPYEWNQSQIDLWFSTLGNHYVCNGAIYQNNLGFWQQYYVGRTPEENMKRQYSEIPWNLVLKNPLFVVEDNFKKLLETIENRRSHSQYFSAIVNYQELSQPQLENLSLVLSKHPDTGKWDYSVTKAFNKCLYKLDVNSEVWNELEKSGKISHISNVPNYILKERILNLSSNKVEKMISSKLFTKEEIKDEIDKLEI